MKRAQVSLEYLSTYSWAIIILLTIISVLSYFGFFNEKALIQTGCDSGAFLSCEDASLQKSGIKTLIKLKLINHMKDDIIISQDLELIEFDIDSCDSTWSDDSIVIERGELWTSPECIIDVDFEEGDIEELSFIVKYKRDQAGSPEHNITGGLKTMVRS